MNNTAKSMHEEKVASLASGYENDGFNVIKEPSISQLPFDLGGYKPDLIAFKGDAGIIVEVKASASRISVDRFQSLAQEIARHEGWRFFLVTLDDVDSHAIPTSIGELPSWPELIDKLEQAKALIAGASLDPAALYLWSIFEAALRKRAISQNIPVERLPASMLLKHMYSQGELSIDELDLLQAFMIKRNRIAHGTNESIEPVLAESFLRSVTTMLAEWSKQDATRTNH